MGSVVVEREVKKYAPHALRVEAANRIGRAVNLINRGEFEEADLNLRVAEVNASLWRGELERLSIVDGLMDSPNLGASSYNLLAESITDEDGGLSDDVLELLGVEL